LPKAVKGILAVFSFSLNVVNFVLIISL
jgi:hypothetical protein